MFSGLYILGEQQHKGEHLMSQIFKDKNGMEFKFEKYGMFGQAISDYPAASGVYIMAKGDTPLYIGESEDLKKWLKHGHENSE